MRYLTIPCLLLLFLARAADRDLAGQYAGDWKSNSSDASGSFRLSLASPSDGAWKCEVTFTLGGEEVKTTACQVKVDQSKLDASYNFDLQGMSLRSHITGTWNGKAFDGQYETTVGEGGAPVDGGTWNATRGKESK